MKCIVSAPSSGMREGKKTSTGPVERDDRAAPQTVNHMDLLTRLRGGRRAGGVCDV